MSTKYRDGRLKWLRITSSQRHKYPCLFIFVYYVFVKFTVQLNIHCSLQFAKVVLACRDPWLSMSKKTLGTSPILLEPGTDEA